MSKSQPAVGWANQRADSATSSPAGRRRDAWHHFDDDDDDQPQPAPNVKPLKDAAAASAAGAVPTAAPDVAPRVALQLAPTLANVTAPAALAGLDLAVLTASVLPRSALAEADEVWTVDSLMHVAAQVCMRDTIVLDFKDAIVCACIVCLLRTRLLAGTHCES